MMAHARRAALVSWLLLAGCRAAGPDTGVVEGAEEVDWLEVAADEARPWQVHVEADLEGPAVATCTADDDPEEVLLVDLEDGVGTARGVGSDRPYRCRLHATDGRALAGAIEREWRSPAFPSYLPSVAASGEADGYTLFNQQRWCDGKSGRLVMVDPEGGLRWAYELPHGLDMAVEALLTPEGRVVWGGGGTPMGAPTEIDLDGEVQSRVSFPGSDAVMFHHDGKRLEDGRLLSLESTGNTVGEQSWTGFRLRRFGTDGAQDWDWSSQQAVDAGQLPIGEDDQWHANWVDLRDEVAYVSLCKTYQVLAIDVATGALRWTLGRGGDFALQDGSGAPLADDQWFQCQHGLEVRGDDVLVYDNGWDRDASRVALYRLDTQLRTATLAWTWEGEGWNETVMGDVDWVGEDHVLIDIGHTECLTESPGVPGRIVEVDVASGAVSWRLDFLDLMDTSYRAERLDGCVFPNAKWCPEVRARVDELAAAGTR